MSDRDSGDAVDLVARLLLSSTPVFGGPLEILYTEVAARRRARAEATIAGIISETGYEHLLERVRENPVVEALFVDAVDAAFRTGLESKRRLLARAAASAILDDAKVDESYLITGALRDLDVPHIRALRRMSDEWDRAQSEPEKVNWGNSEAFAAEPEAIRAALIRTGTAKPARQQFVARTGPQRADGISDFGLELLQELRREGLEGDRNI